MAKSTKIHDQEQALSVYFKDMLGEPVTSEPTPVTTKTERSVLTSNQTSPVAELTAETAEKPQPQIVEQEKPPIEQTGEIKLLLCKVAGIEVAVPVNALNNIVRWPTENPITKIPGKAPWDLGIFSHNGVHTEVIDVSHLLVPEHQTPEVDALKADYILLVDNHKWGITCEQIHQIITLPANEVNWRSDTQQRPWFSGIVNDKMSSVVDVDALLAAIQKG